MRKKVMFLSVMVFVFTIFSTVIFAAQGYDFKIQYDGNIMENVQKSGNVLLVGTGATAYTNVRIKVDVSGPATPSVIATDSNGNEFDIVKIGYWGPASGFAVGGDFTNTTPVKVTYPKAGSYSVILSLIDVKNGNSIITSETITVNVLSNKAPDENIDEIPEDEITQLPQTGIGITQYIIYTVAILAIVLTILLVINRKKQRE